MPDCTPPLPSRPWFAVGLPLLGAFPAAGFVSDRAVLASRSGRRVVCAGVMFRLCNRRNHPTPISPYLPVFYYITYAQYAFVLPPASFS